MRWSGAEPLLMRSLAVRALHTASNTAPAQGKLAACPADTTLNGRPCKDMTTAQKLCEPGKMLCNADDNSEKVQHPFCQKLCFTDVTVWVSSLAACCDLRA